MFALKQLLSFAVFSALVTFTSAQAGAGCSRNGTVQNNDTCDILSARDSVSTFQLANANKAAIDTFCDNIFPGELLCLGLNGQDCTTVAVVKAGDSCGTIANTAGIPVTTLLANNPNVNSGCSNIYPGEVLCTASQIVNYS
ncbi:hypothetical protein BC827DRAFT_56327 [Russula dissimulans]|nr:hypothetical protein BC827DRAFT_56327 [Russula dissimulans]